MNTKIALLLALALGTIVTAEELFRDDFSKLPPRFTEKLDETKVFSHTAYSFPALLPEWERATGWGKTGLSLAFSGALVVSALTTPVTGRLVDRGHGRALMTAGPALGAAALAAMSQAGALWLFQVLIVYEPLIIFFGLASLIVSLRRLTSLVLLLSVWTIGALVVALVVAATVYALMPQPVSRTTIMA